MAKINLVAPAEQIIQSVSPNYSDFTNTYSNSETKMSKQTVDQ